MKILAWQEAKCTGSSLPIVGPLVKLGAKITESPTINEIVECDVFYVHRPISPKHVESIVLAKSLGKKVITLNDDDQLSLPMDHFCYFQYADMAVKSSIIQSNTLADAMVLSNEEIKKTYGTYNEKCFVVPCAYPDELYRHSEGEKAKVVFFRGTNAERSLREVSKGIIEVANDFKDWEFHFVCKHPWWITENLKNKWYCWEWMDTERLWTHLKAMRPRIMIAPRVDNQFTRSRSNMAFMDAQICGAETLAPDWEIWRAPSVMNYKNVIDFRTKLRSMMESGPSYAELEQGRKHALKHHSFSSSAEQHKNILSEVMK